MASTAERPPWLRGSPLPATMASCASIVAFIADPHIFESVVHGVALGSPALSDAWRQAAASLAAGPS